MRLRPPRRALPVLALALLAGCGRGCGSRLLPFEDATLDLARRVERAEVEVAEPWEPPEDVRLEWLRDGLCGLRVPLTAAGARRSAADGVRQATWTLPLPVASSAASERYAPWIDGATVARLAPGVAPDPELRAGFWAHGDEVSVVWREGEELPAGLELVYPVVAARLAGSALVAGYPSEEVLRLRRLRGDVSVDALAVPGGGTLRMLLPPLPAPGRLEAGVATAAAADAPADGPAVVVRLAGERLAREGTTLDGLPTPLGWSDGTGARVPASDAARVLEVEVEGPPGSVAFLEAPVWTRTRSWRDGPNVLLVVVDTLRADRLGEHGNRDELTPALDRLAREGIRFDQAWSTSSWTLPSVATMLTSTHAGQHRAWVSGARLGPGLPTLAEVFREAGYRTAAFTGGGFVSPAFGLDRGFQTFDARGGGVEAVVERAEAWLDEVGDGPWFLLVHTYEVHAPYEPPEGARKRVLRSHPDALRDRGPDPSQFFDLAEAGRRVPKEVAAALRALYDEEVRYTDHVLGRFLDELRARDLYRPAVVCLTSDHGEEFGEHGFLGHGDTLYAEQLHVPLLLKLPEGRQAARVVEPPVSLLDLAPTLLDAAGLLGRAPETFVGGSLLDGLRDSPVYAQRQHDEAGPLHAAREGPHAVVMGRYFFPELRERGLEFYVLGRDPWQQRNLAREGAGRDVKQMQKRLQALSQRYGEAMVQEERAAVDPELAARLGALGYN